MDINTKLKKNVVIDIIAFTFIFSALFVICIDSLKIDLDMYVNNINIIIGIFGNFLGLILLIAMVIHFINNKDIRTGFKTFIGQG